MNLYYKRIKNGLKEKEPEIFVILIIIFIIIIILIKFLDNKPVVNQNIPLKTQIYIPKPGAQPLNRPMWDYFNNTTTPTEPTINF